VASAFECRLFYSYFKYALTSEQHRHLSIFNLVVFFCFFFSCFNYNLSAWWLDNDNVDGDDDFDDGDTTSTQTYLKFLTFICC